eukprot:5055270-Amphidinium_carterae.2
MLSITKLTWLQWLLQAAYSSLIARWARIIAESHDDANHAIPAIDARRADAVAAAWRMSAVGRIDVSGPSTKSSA